MTRLFALPLTYLCLSVLLACDGGSLTTGSRSQNEIVMCPGASLVVTQHGETLRIAAVKLTSRTYEIDNTSQTINLTPRTERWYGSMGLYSPTGTRSMHLSVEEGYQFFASNDELLEWIKLGNAPLSLVYSSDGLVIGWRYEHAQRDKPPALVASVWQTFVNGAKPSALVGANDATIQRVGDFLSCGHPTSKYVAAAPQTIEGRLYSGRSLDIMRERGITAKMVEAAIQHGKLVERQGKYLFYVPNDTPESALYWVWIDDNGRVVLVA